MPQHACVSVRVVHSLPPLARGPRDGKPCVYGWSKTS